MNRVATAQDIEELQQLLLEHGPNEWNYLPHDEVCSHLSGIATNETYAVVATDEDKIIGMVSYNLGDFYPEYESEVGKTKPRGYVAEAVVHRDYSGKGIGSNLLELAKSMLRQMGVDTIYIKRHEENRGSAGMMRKAGFEIVDVFADSIRTSGSGRTAVERFRFRS